MIAFKKVFILAVLILFIPLTVFSLGYRNPSIGPRSSGMATAVSADTKSPEIIYYNPAGMVFIEGAQISMGADFVTVDVSHRDTGGNYESTGYELFAIPDVYFSWRPKGKPFAVGVAVNAPYGLGFGWDETSFARLDIYKARLNMFDIQPTVAFSFTEKFSIGFGFNLYVGNLDFSSKIDLAQIQGLPALTGVEIDSRYKGSGFVQTINVGAMAKPIKGLTLALSFKTGKKMDYDGTLTLTNVPLALGLGSDTVSYDADTNIFIPAVLTFGIEYYLLEKLKVEFDLDWTRWSAFNNQPLTITANPLLNQNFVRNWEDSFMYSFGLEWFALNWLALRCGYLFAENSIPDATYEPGIPDFDRHIIATGVGIKYKNYMINAAYNAVVYKANTVDNDVLAPLVDLDGVYNGFAHIFSLGMQYTF